VARTLSFDLLIRGGVLVDGTGAERRAADVGIRDGRITAIGNLDGPANNTIDAQGCLVTPGFVDPHTHLDAQLCWDATAAPSCFHGITTVVMGLCGFGVAPSPPGGDDYLLRSLEVVEEIPFASTRDSVPFSWSSWPEYMAFIGSRPLGVHVAGFVPHSALRYSVMGERARSEVATPAERDAMREQLEQALAAGAIGLATSRGPNHKDAFGAPVPSRFADDDELRTLVSACRGRIWQINVATKFAGDATALLDEIGQYADWTRAAGARLSWTPFHAEPKSDVWRQVLADNEARNADGLVVAPQVMPQPITVVIRFDEFSYAALVDGWQPVMKGFYEQSIADRLAKLADPTTRAILRSGTTDEQAMFSARFDEWTILRSATLPQLTGVTVAVAARNAGVEVVDWLCELLIADRLSTTFQLPIINRDSDASAALIASPTTLIGLGDSGAHVGSINNFGYPTFILSQLVRDAGVLSIEQAVCRLSGHPAAVLGLDDRGCARVGTAADLNVIDLDALAISPLEVRDDLPGGVSRLFQSARGYRYTIVAGDITVDDGRLTGRTPGKIARVS
jgi:N-acyl-D-amino-acid deacylase